MVGETFIYTYGRFHRLKNKTSLYILSLESMQKFSEVWTFWNSSKISALI